MLTIHPAILADLARERQADVQRSADAVRLRKNDRSAVALHTQPWARARTVLIGLARGYRIATTVRLLTGERAESGPISINARPARQGPKPITTPAPHAEVALCDTSNSR